MATRQIDHIVRLTNSVNGNPRYSVHFTDGSVAQTQSDASVNYAVENLSSGTREIAGVYIPFNLNVEFSRGGRITHLEVVV